MDRSIELAKQGILGAICGDIIGSYYEFHPTKMRNFTLFLQKSHPTDDTNMTLAVASWLMKGDLSKKALVREMQELGRRYPHCGFGGRFKQWLQEEDPQPYESFGNGAVMRISPIAYYGIAIKDDEKALELAQLSCEVSHNHPEAIKAAKAVVQLTYHYFYQWYQDAYRWCGQAYYPQIFKDLNDIRYSYKFEVSCQKSVPQSIMCTWEPGTYEGVVRSAVAMGGDADTMACIAGGICAANREIPEEIISKAREYLDDYQNKIVDDFMKFIEIKYIENHYKKISKEEKEQLLADGHIEKKISE